MQTKSNNVYYMLGVICITMSFIVALILVIGASISGTNNADKAILENYLPRFYAMESALQAKANELGVEANDVEGLQNKLPDDTVWIMDVDTGEIVLASGSLKGITKDSIYGIYAGANELGRFRIDNVLKYVAMGRIIDYQKSRFPENTRFFKAKPAH